MSLKVFSPARQRLQEPLLVTREGSRLPALIRVEPEIHEFILVGREELLEGASYGLAAVPAACLASRIPYGTPVTIQNIKQVETGEEELKALGFRQFRVRFHEQLVRIEIAKDEMEKAFNLEMAAQMTAVFKRLGFPYVTLDLEGYRQGAMNEVLKIRKTG